MSKWLLTLAGLLLIFSGGCCCKDLEECRDSLADCAPNGPEVVEVDPAAFELVLLAESYGTFLPVTNQFPCPPEPDPQDAFPENEARCRPIHSGFFLQLSDFAGSAHSYSDVVLEFAIGDPVELDRQDFKWIDIVCVDNYPDILTPEQAQMLLPLSAEGGRLLHKDMDWEFTNLVTLWRSTLGLSVEQISSPFYDDQEFQHSHDVFTFTSQEACEVRVWDALDSDQPSQTYSVAEPATRVVKIEVIEAPTPANHGGVHHPPWN